MKPIRVISTAVLFLFFGATSLTCAEQQNEQQDKNKEQHKQNQDQNKQQHSQQQDKNKQPQQQHVQQQQHTQQQDQNKQQQQHVQHQDLNKQQHSQQQQLAAPPHQQQANHPAHPQQAVWQPHRAHSWESEHRTWQQRGGYVGYRIPENHFHAYFGPGHGFRIHSLPVIVIGGYPRFQYGGYWFSLVDPWPEYWSDNWYENDDMYVDYYGGGYYLYNRRHPGNRIAIRVYVN